MISKPTACSQCVLYGDGAGFVPASGSGANGVLMVLEAAGEHEAAAGVPVVGKAGHALFTQLKRAGIDREGFRIHNVLSCRPPDNKLAGMPYEKQAIAHCSPNLYQTILQQQVTARENGKTFVILTMGRTAFKRVMGLDESTHERLLKEDYTNYPFWNEQYKAWVIAVDHPSYLMRGNHHLWPTLTYGVQRALEIANSGLTLDTTNYLLDPTVSQFDSWYEDFEDHHCRSQSPTYLSYDIETPMKRGQDEEKVSKESDDDFTILRVSFCYTPGHAVSIPWNQEFLPTLKKIFAHPCKKLGWNNSNYDFPRVLKAVREVNGDQIDGMLAWHVVNSSLPKGLGFVTPFYWPNTSMWKHLSDNEPAFYNAKDADAALRNWLGIKKDLAKNNQSHVFDRHVIEVNRVFDYMRKKGVPFDKNARDAAERKVGGILAEIDAEIEATIPIEARQLKVYKKTPADTTGLIEVTGEKKVKICPGCHAVNVGAPHFKSIGKKRLKLGEPENPCFGLKSCVDNVVSSLWARPLPFKLSQKQLLAYQAVKNQKPIWNKKENRITFDEDAINRLLKKYPNDKLYPLIDSRRQPGKLLSTYIGRTVDGVVVGGIPVDPDGMIRTTFTHNPSTLRSASQRPNLQNIPRAGALDNIASLIRGFFVASPGHTFWAADYSGIEALLCGYFANYPEYMRLTKIDVHSFYTAYAIYELDKRIPANDLPLLSWDDAKLAARLAEIKKEFKSDRNNLYKHLVHGNNFMQGVEGSQRKIYLETGVEPPFALVKKVMDVYFGLFPGIKAWHNRLLLQASDQGYLRNPFGYIHRFNRVFEWEKLYGSEWSKKPGPQANEVVAFLPQSTAAGIIKEAMLRIFQNHFDRAGQYLRLLIHDELFFMVPHDAVEILARIVQMEMEKPIPEMPMLLEWNMGSHLWVGTESKMGDKWSLMK